MGRFAKMKLFFLSSVFGAINGYNLRNRNTETQEARQPAPSKPVINVDDYGYVIERDYNSAFVSNGDSETKDPTWTAPDSEIEAQEAYDQQISEEEKEDFDYTEIQAPETDPFLNSKFDKNRVWVSTNNNNNEDGVEWVPTDVDQDQLQADNSLSYAYEG